MHDDYLGRHIGRRRFITQSLALGALLLLPAAARAGSIARSEGEVSVNGRRASVGTEVFGGDSIITGAGASVSFVVGGDAYFLRANSRLDMTGQGSSGTIIAALRLVSGALGAAFSRGGERRIFAPNVTAGIRGTGVYVQVSADSTYFCTCYGTVELTATQGGSDGMREMVSVAAVNHQARTIKGASPTDMRIEEAPLANHTNAEMIALEALAGRPDPFAQR